MYTNEKHALILLSLLKAHGVKKIVVSPGSTNIPLSGSVQNDPYFEVYSSVDERSAAYIACGLAERSGELVAISCTGATASRNYLPGLTEAYYRKLPVIAITSFNGNENVGHLVPQNLDRTVIQKDVAKISVHLPLVKDDVDEWYCNVLVNKALIEARRNGRGPVHINMTSLYTGVFDVAELPSQRKIDLITAGEDIPSLADKKVVIFIGSHKPFSEEETVAIANFCERRNAVVVCDHTSSYRGGYRIGGSLIASNYGRLNPLWKSLCPDVVIHLGEVSGDYPSSRVLSEADEVWRVSEDGEIRDTGRRLRYVYQGSEKSFFTKMGVGDEPNKYYPLWKGADERLRSLVPELPFSNLWVASCLSKKLDSYCFLYLGILNSLRSWNYFKVSDDVRISCNVGGFGIDGCMSTALGGALTDKSHLHFIVLGDLAFFYDINSLANRHLGKNIRIILINNGCGVEFNNSSHIASRFGVDANEYIAAGGHFNAGDLGRSNVLSPEERSAKSLAKAWCESLGFKYFSAMTKEEFDSHMVSVLDDQLDCPVILECFTDVLSESSALEIITTLDKTAMEKVANKAKKILPSSVSSRAKSILLRR